MYGGSIRGENTGQMHIQIGEPYRANGAPNGGAYRAQMHMHIGPK